MDAHKYRPSRNSAEYGSVVEGKLLSGIAGHNICLDYFGSPSAEEAKLGLSQHGEAPNNKWSIVAHSAQTSKASITLTVPLPAAGLHLLRKIELCQGESVVYFEETIRNERRADHFFHWTQHVTLGPQFLHPEASTIAISGSKGLTSPHGYDEGKAMLASGRKFRWPKAPLATKGTADLTRPFSRTGLGYVVGVLVDPARDIGFIAALSPKERLVFGYCFSRADFPWIAVWEENLAIEAIPWKRRSQALGLEFGTTPIPAGRRDSFLNGGSLFGTPTKTFIPALQTRSVGYLAFLASVPPEFLALRNIKIEGNEILLFSTTSRIPVRVAGSRIAKTLQISSG
jgi:hypothetical protein